jgi:hypothetical protein
MRATTPSLISIFCCLDRYRLSPETFRYTFVLRSVEIYDGCGIGEGREWMEGTVHGGTEKAH